MSSQTPVRTGKSPRALLQKPGACGGPCRRYAASRAAVHRGRRSSCDRGSAGPSVPAPVSPQGGRRDGGRHCGSIGVRRPRSAPAAAPSPSHRPAAGRRARRYRSRRQGRTSRWRKSAAAPPRRPRLRCSSARAGRAPSRWVAERLQGRSSRGGSAGSGQDRIWRPRCEPSRPDTTRKGRNATGSALQDERVSPSALARTTT